MPTPSTSQTCPPPDITPDSNGWVPPGTCGYLSRPYYPSFGASLALSTLAAILVGAYILAIARYRRRCVQDGGNTLVEGDRWASAAKGEFIVPCGGGLISVVLLTGYVLRVLSTRDMQEVVFIAGSDLVVLVCPILVTALTSFVLTRLLATILPDANNVLPRILLFAPPPLFLLQLVSAIMIIPKHRPTPTTPSAPTAMLGIKWYLFGLALHLALLVFALTLAIFLHKRLSGQHPPLSSNQETDAEVVAWKARRRVLFAVSFSLGAVMTRVVYRLVELSGLLNGHLTSLASNEVYFYALECAPVVVGVAIWAVVEAGPSVLEGKSGGDYVYEEVSGEIDDEEGVVMKKMGVGR